LPLISLTQRAGNPSQDCLDSLNDPLLLKHWFLVAWSSDIATGQIVPFRLLGRDLVLWRSSTQLHCWLDLCIHRGAKLSLGIVQLSRADDDQRSDCLVCPYHGWKYAESGQCVHIPAHPDFVPPAKARAQSHHVRERYGAVWVCLGELEDDPPEFPFAETAGFRTVPAGPYRFNALGPRVIENALDVAHLGYVHAGLLGDPQRLEIEDYEVEDGPSGPEAKQISIWQPNPDGTGRGAMITYHYWICAPLTMAFEKTGDEGRVDSRRFAILAQVFPIDSERSEMRMLMCMNYGGEFSDEELRAFQDRVTEQDRLIVESQRPELLPLDLQAEFHLRSDRMAIAYRRWLRSIGLRYGTA
jgi:phenylpropionate dioxygenase-like ring-hydroxylating dioxygenase large terminal subunit